MEENLQSNASVPGFETELSSSSIVPVSRKLLCWKGPILVLELGRVELGILWIETWVRFRGQLSGRVRWRNL